MIKLLVVFGTRPEAIKLAPLIHLLKAYPKNFEVKVCVTAQHRSMLDQVLNFFNINPDFDLDLMRENQNLYQLTSDVLLKIQPIIATYDPHFVFVHGDTTTSAIAALAAYYAGIKVCHVEAGLRTYNKNAPFPEEINRQITGRLADLHFAPTQAAANNLINEGVDKSSIYVTGNTVIDALYYAEKKVEQIIDDEEIAYLTKIVDGKKKMLLVTGHRRENFGEGFTNICSALKQIATNNTDLQIIYPVHLNPNVATPVYEQLSEIDNIKLIKPLSYPAFIWLMKRAYIILTDSGGIQEEAPSLGLPVLVMRDTTERPEAVEAGTVKLVGTNTDLIVSRIEALLNNKNAYDEMSTIANPYGDGHACDRIVELLLKKSL